MRSAVPLAVLLVSVALPGCGSNEPAWAIDPTFLDPGASPARGNQTWQIYAEPWTRRFDARHFVCAVLVDLEITPSEPDCPGCTQAFTVAPTLVDTDCPEALAGLPDWTSLVRLGLGEVPGDGPHPSSAHAWADHGAGWADWGWAHPDALDRGETPGSPTWNGDEPFAFVPSGALSLLGEGTVAPVSRSAPPEPSARVEPSAHRPVGDGLPAGLARGVHR